jgi:hypothetical protein
MRPKAFVTSTLIGGLTVFLTGVSMFAFPPLQRFYTYAMTAGAASEVPRDSPLLWAAVVAALATTRGLVFLRTPATAPLESVPMCSAALGQHGRAEPR